MRKQGGIAALELVLLAVVIIALGFVGYHTYMSRSTAGLNSPSNVSTAADGNVDHAVNAVTDGVARESSASVDSNETDQVNSLANDAANVEGSFNENDF